MGVVCGDGQLEEKEGGEDGDGWHRGIWEIHLGRGGEGD